MQGKFTSMALPRFFKTKAPDKFDYQPIYWDPEKERREARINSIKAELGYDISGEGVKGRPSTITRGSFRNYSSQRTRINRESNRRILFLVAFLLLIAYLLLYR